MCSKTNKCIVCRQTDVRVRQYEKLIARIKSHIKLEGDIDRERHGGRRRYRWTIGEKEIEDKFPGVSNPDLKYFIGFFYEDTLKESQEIVDSIPSNPHTRGIEPNLFTRWLDIRDSEDELHEFLTVLVKNGQKERNHTSQSITDLEDNAGGDQ